MVHYENLSFIFYNILKLFMYHTTFYH